MRTLWLAGGRCALALAAASVLVAAAHPDRVLATAAPPGASGDSRAAAEYLGLTGGSGRGRWPLDGRPAVVRRFSPPPTPYGRGHRGADLGSQPGAIVRAAASGTVTFAGTVGDKGVVVVAHAGGLRTTYEPVTATATVGTQVLAGAPIGILDPGHAGCPVPACLHWGLRRGDVYLDPLTLLGLGQVRLLPLSHNAEAVLPARASG
jgi:murein DD-endopeptidase MepM/ murein hydrolase activator NlpD